jgi:galactose mutarotase-like enzyme
MSIIYLKNKNSNVEISTLGAQIISFNHQQKEAFAHSENHRRSGVPILFPFAGELSQNYNNCKQHGFVRDIEWEILDQDDTNVLFCFSFSDITKINFPFEFVIFYDITLNGNTLTTEMEIISNSPNMPISPGIHPYFLPTTSINNSEFGDLEDRKLILNNFNQKYNATVYGYKDILLNYGNYQVSMKDLSGFATKIVAWSEDKTKHICLEPWMSGFDGFLDNPKILQAGESVIWNMQYQILL